VTATGSSSAAIGNGLASRLAGASIGSILAMSVAASSCWIHHNHRSSIGRRDGPSAFITHGDRLVLEYVMLIDYE
jgi:hypothetical protein